MVHFVDEIAGDSPQTEQACGARCRPDPADLVSWISRYADATSLFLLYPERHNARIAPIMREENRSLLPYAEDLASSIPELPPGKNVWVINAARWSPFDWNAARSVASRRDGEVLLFAPSLPAIDDHCAEFLRVEESGEVTKCVRHYVDSPASADLRPVSVSFLVCAGKDAQAVVAHLAVHGWGMDSIGLLTRHFRIRWSRAASMRSPNGGKSRKLTSDRINRTPSGFRAMWRPNRAVRRGSPRVTNAAVSAASAAIATDRPAGDVRSTLTARTGAVRGRQSPTMSFASTESARPDAAVEPWANHDEAIVGAIQGEPVIGGTYPYAKRMMDIGLSAFGLLLCLPVFVAVAILLKVTSPGPVFFRHKRQGVGGKEFDCLKFRTMVVGADTMQDQLRAQNEVDGPQFKIAQDPRLTRCGALLRRYNIDELPQLINVLRGEMSFVGPRPSPDNENQFCPAWRRARLSVRPGITGLWQVMRLRNDPESDFQEWIYYDLEYARHCSFWLDWQLLLHTPVAIFAPKRLGGLAQRLEHHGICIHSPRILHDVQATSSDHWREDTASLGHAPESCDLISNRKRSAE